MASKVLKLNEKRHSKVPNAAAYSSYNDMQRRDAKETIEKYWYKLQWRKDGADSILDVGCGTGDIAHDYIWPQLPPNYGHYVGIDYSREMIEYARQKYPHPKAYYEQYDITGDLNKQGYKHEPYDHIVSLWGLNCVQNQKLAYQNMWKLLKKGGDMLVGFLAQNPIYDIYKEMAKDSRWSKYMSDVDQYVPPYHWSTNPAEDYKNLTKSYGYKNIWCETWDKYYIWEGVTELKNGWTSVNPWWKKIPANEKEAYWKCYLDWYIKKGYSLGDWKEVPENCRFINQYKWLVAYAQK